MSLTALQAAENISGRRLRGLKNVSSYPLRRFKRTRRMTLIACSLQLEAIRDHRTQSSNQRNQQDRKCLRPEAAQEVCEGQALQPGKILQNHLRSGSIEVARSQTSLLRLPQATPRTYLQLLRKLLSEIPPLINKHSKWQAILGGTWLRNSVALLVKRKARFLRNFEVMPQR